jgi:hypothetical protein
MREERERLCFERGDATGSDQSSQLRQRAVRRKIPTHIAASLAPIRASTVRSASHLVISNLIELQTMTSNKP